MKKIRKKLSAILFVAICCALLFPMTAMAEELIEEPLALPETMIITKRLFSDSGEFEKVTIESHNDGRFSFEYPAQTVADMHGYGDDHSITAFRVEGTAYYRMDKEMERKFGANDSRWIVGEFSVPEEIIYTELTPSVSEAYSNTRRYTFVPYGGSFGSTTYGDEDSEHDILFKIQLHCTETNTIYDAAGGSETTESTYDTEWTFSMKTVGFVDPYPIEDTDSGESAAKNKKKLKLKGEFIDEGDGTFLRISWGNGNSRNNDFADPLTTLVISILSILLSILFGTTGGFTPPVPAGAGVTPVSSPAGTGDAPAPTSGGDGLGKWLRFDEDGDIEATDPANGQKRTYVHNGDGTYTNPITGATYTPDELSGQMEHRAENAETIRQDEAQFERNVREDRERNQERSDESKQLEKELLQERQEREHREKVERVALKLGMSGASEKDVVKELERRMEKDERFRDAMLKSADILDTSITILEVTEEVADYTMAAGEVLAGPAGKTISATYKGIKNIGSTVAEKGLSTGSVIEGAIKGGTEAATTIMNAGVGKAATTIGGTVAGEVAGAVNDGKDITKATAEGLIKGAGNATIGAVSDGVEDAATTVSSKVATKVAEAVSGKEAEALYDKMFEDEK